MKKLVILLAALAACGQPDRDEVDMTFRVSLSWLENTCDAAYADRATTMVDVVPDGEGTHDLRFRHLDLRSEPLYGGIEIRGGETAFKTVWTSERGNGSLYQGVKGRIGRDRIDVTVTSLWDHSETGHVCTRSYRLHGPARAYGDPVSLDGMYRGRRTMFKERCEGDVGEVAVAGTDTAPFFVGQSEGGSIAANLAQYTLHMVEAPDGNLRSDPQSTLIIDGDWAFPLKGGLSGLLAPDNVDLKGFLEYASRDGKDCRWDFEILGRKIIPDPSAPDNEYRVRKSFKDDCHPDEITYPWTGLAEIVSQADGSLVLLEGGRRVPIRLDGGAFHVSRSDSAGWETMSYTGRLDPPSLTYAVEHVTRYGRTCTKTTTAVGRARFVE